MARRNRNRASGDNPAPGTSNDRSLALQRVALLLKLDPAKRSAVATSYFSNKTEREGGRMMPRFGRSDATGRSSGIRSGSAAKVYRPPKGEPWGWLTRELVSSPAWRSCSINCVRLIDFLMVENMNHAGAENGNLKATYDQLVAWGLTRSEIRPAIKEADFLGLVRFVRGGRWAGSNQPSTYRLTFWADREGNAPTNDWKGKTPEAIETWKQDRAQRNRARSDGRQKQIPSATSRTTVVRLPELRADRKGNGR